MSTQREGIVHLYLIALACLDDWRLVGIASTMSCAFFDCFLWPLELILGCLNLVGEVFDPNEALFLFHSINGNQAKLFEDSEETIWYYLMNFCLLSFLFKFLDKLVTKLLLDKHVVLQVVQIWLRHRVGRRLSPKRSQHAEVLSFAIVYDLLHGIPLQYRWPISKHIVL